MKKLSFLLVSLGITLITYAQPVSDNATIPVSVTLNSILRLNVTSGGNIEFAVNTLDQYTNGIVNSAATTTRFTVASSVDFVVSMYSESTDLGSNDNVGGTGMPLTNVGYFMKENGTGVIGTAWTIPAYNALVAPQAVLTSGSVDIITGLTGASAGDIAKNDFAIHWELATPAVNGIGSAGTLLSQNLAADRYSTNVLLVLSKLP